MRCRRLTALSPVALAEKFKLGLSEEESQQLTVKYDLKDNGRFAYCDFLQSCVLLLRAKETSLMQRMKIQNMDKMVRGGRSAAGRGGGAGTGLRPLASCEGGRSGAAAA